VALGTVTTLEAEGTEEPELLTKGDREYVRDRPGIEALLVDAAEAPEEPEARLPERVADRELASPPVREVAAGFTDREVPRERVRPGVPSAAAPDAGADEAADGRPRTRVAPADPWVPARHGAEPERELMAGRASAPMAVAAAPPEGAEGCRPITRRVLGAGASALGDAGAMVRPDAAAEGALAVDGGVASDRGVEADGATARGAPCDGYVRGDGAAPGFEKERPWAGGAE